LPTFERIRSGPHFVADDVTTVQQQFVAGRSE